MEPAREVKDIKLMTVGDAGVGKSALVRAFCEEANAQNEEATVGADFKVRMLKHAGKDFRVNIWDSSGELRFLEVRNEFYREAQGVILVFDVTSRRSFQNLEKWMDEVAKYAQGSEPQFAVVGTKTDLTTTRMVQEQTGRDWAKSKSIPYFETSAAQGRNVEMVFKEMSNWASDVEVQQTSFDEIIVCASRPTRFMMSTVALELLKGQASGWPRTIDFSMLGKAPKNLEDLELEVTKDKCTLITTSSGEVERLAAVSAIAISRTNGTTLMQLGSWDPEQGELKVGCKLPGTKQEAGETAVEAMQRLLKKDLLAFSEQIDLQQAIAKHELEWSRSEKYNLRTKYLRTIFQLTVDDDDDWPELQRLQSYDKDGVPGKARISARRSRMLPGSFGADDDDIEPCIADFAEVIGLPDGDGQRLLICGWLRDEDAERFKGEGDGKVSLQKAMARIHIDELILSSVKERLACCQLPPSGEMVLSEGDRFSSLTVVPQQS
ncbi:unnamed protein product [Effrenium voratum]|nr:unnamed protein product [Effrenium voratum]